MQNIPFSINFTGVVLFYYACRSLWIFENQFVKKKFFLGKSLEKFLLLWYTSIQIKVIFYNYK